MNDVKRENHDNNFCKNKINQVSNKDEVESSSDINKAYIDEIFITISQKITYLDKIIANLLDRLKKIEKDIALKDLEGKLNKHYEQSRRR